ncbi:6-phosphogluconolactonase [Demequina sp.]|uniref:6-phosphogluconolactonase n=1 Tax=Demequina sp. TaxID=2050685 RepID=UPI003D0FDDBC
MTAPAKNRRVVVYPDAATVATATAARLLTHLVDTLTVKERADIILTGGTVGIRTLSEVAASPLRDTVDWTAVHVWWGDERFVAAGDPDRNEGQAQEALLAHLPVPEENIHRMGSTTEFETAEDAAAAYLADFEAQGEPVWDVAMFGMGPDGHVASLFPSHPVFVTGSEAVSAVHDSPKPPSTRVTLSVDLINRAHQVWIVAAGDEKAEAIAKALKGDKAIPASAVCGTDATLWLIDAAAAAQA